MKETRVLAVVPPVAPGRASLGAGGHRTPEMGFMTPQFAAESPEAATHRDTLLSACYNIYRNSL